MKMLPLPGTLRGYYISSNRIESKWRIPLIFLRTYVQKRYIRNKSCTCRPEETRKRRLRISCTNGIRQHTVGICRASAICKMYLFSSVQYRLHDPVKNRKFHHWRGDQFVNRVSSFNQLDEREGICTPCLDLFFFLFLLLFFHRTSTRFSKSRLHP